MKQWVYERALTWWCLEMVLEKAPSVATGEGREPVVHLLSEGALPSATAAGITIRRRLQCTREVPRGFLAASLQQMTQLSAAA